MEVDQSNTQHEPNGEDNPQSFMRREKTKSQQIQEAYFQDRMKPTKISKLLKVDRQKIYSIAEMTKRSLISCITEDKSQRQKKRIVSSEAKAMIKDFCHFRANHNFKVDSIHAHLKVRTDGWKVPSVSWIRNYIKQTLKLSHKAVSCRPPKVKTSALKVLQLEYINFVTVCKSSGYKIIQIDKFPVNRATCPTKV